MTKEMKTLLKFTIGTLMMILGIILIDYGVNRIATDVKMWLGVLQLIIGVANIVSGYNKVQSAILE